MRFASLLLVTFSFASTAWAAPRAAIVGIGDCSDSDLVRGVRMISERLANTPGLVLATDAEVAAKVGAKPQRSLEEIQRQIDSAQQLFYQAQYFTALERVDAALLEIKTLPPGMPRWQLSVGAYLLEALVRGRLKNGTRTAEDAFLDVLRLDAKYQLNPDYFSPSTIKHFEKLRTSLSKRARHRLTVTSQPSATTVYLDGREVGRTPMTVDLLPGSYRLQVGKNDRYSIQREVDLAAPEEVHVNFALEGAIANRSPLCFEASGLDEQKRLGVGAQLGTVLGVEQLVLLRYERPDIGPHWFAATLVGVDGGRRIREGGFEIRSDDLGPDEVVALAQYIATGERSGRVVVDIGGATPPPDDVNAAAAPEPSTPFFSSSWRRPTAYALLGTGAALGAGGLLFQVRSGTAADSYRALAKDGINPEEATAAREALDTSKSSQTFAYVGYAVGALALGGGAALLLLGPDEPSSPTTGSFVLLPSAGPGGVGALVTGRF